MQQCTLKSALTSDADVPQQISIDYIMQDCNVHKTVLEREADKTTLLRLQNIDSWLLFDFFSTDKKFIKQERLLKIK